MTDIGHKGSVGNLHGTLEDAILENDKVRQLRIDHDGHSLRLLNAHCRHRCPLRTDRWQSREFRRLTEFAQARIVRLEDNFERLTDFRSTCICATQGQISSELKRRGFTRTCRIECLARIEWQSRRSRHEIRHLRKQRAGSA